MITRFMAFLARILGWGAQPDLPMPQNHSPKTPQAPPSGVPTVPESVSPNAQKLVLKAKECLGENLSAGTGVPYYVACAVSVNRVHALTFGEAIGGGASTLDLYKVLLKHPSFKEVQEAEAGPGTVVICPTGYGLNPRYPHGHVGILCEHGICANDSATGLWTESYADLHAWKYQFGTIEGFPTYLFLRV